MFYFISALLHSIFKTIFSNRKDLIFTLMLLKKENEIYKRQLNLRKIQTNMKRRDRFFLSLISTQSKRAISHLTLIKPSTILNWQRRFIKNFWTYKHKTPGRRPVSKEIKDLILEMKRDNQLWALIAILRIAARASIPDAIELRMSLKRLELNWILQLSTG